LPLAQALDDLKAQAQIELSLAWTHKYGDEQTEPAILHFHASEQLARKAGLREQLGLAMLELGTVYISSGQLEQAKSALWESVEIFRELDHRPRVQDGLHNLAIIHMETGEFAAALTCLDEAYRANEALGSPTEMYSLALTRNAIRIVRGEYNQAVEALLTGLEMDDSQMVAWLRADIRQELAWCYYDLGAYDEGLSHCQKVINYPSYVSPSGHSPVFAILALLQIGRGELRAADVSVAKGWEKFNLQRMTYWGWWEALSILSAEAELALAQGQLARAARCVGQLLGKYDELKLRYFKPGVLYLRARVSLAAGNKEEAYQSLSEALTLSDELGAHREVWAMCWELSQLEAERGNESASAQLRERACAEVTFIADHAGTPELKATFLARPEVRKVAA
jgi:tetratricopeptide (TPR) repeat protein